MATIIEVRIPVEEFALVESIENGPDFRIEIEQLVAQDSESAMPFVWVTTAMITPPLSRHSLVILALRSSRC